MFVEYKPNSKKENRKLLKSVPNYVPKFGEAKSIVDYPYHKIKWQDLYGTKLSKENLLNKLKFYRKKIKPEMYNDDPDLEPDFKSAHMGIFNMYDYCNVHDILLLNNPRLALDNKYFITDYHPLGLPRMFVMNEMGNDLMPKISKNMPKINWH